MFVTGFQVSAVARNHAISGCDTVSYPFNKGKISALNILKAGQFTALYEVLGDENATDAELMETGRRFFTVVYGQPEGTTIATPGRKGNHSG